MSPALSVPFSFPLTQVLTSLFFLLFFCCPSWPRMPACSPCLHLPSPGITGMPHRACHSLWFLSLPLFLLSWASPPLSFHALSFDLFRSWLLYLSCLSSIFVLEILVTSINCVCVCMHEYAPAHVPPCMCVCKSEHNLQEPVLSYHVGSRYPTRVSCMLPSSPSEPSHLPTRVSYSRSLPFLSFSLAFLPFPPSLFSPTLLICCFIAQAGISCVAEAGLESLSAPLSRMLGLQAQRTTYTYLLFGQLLSCSESRFLFFGFTISVLSPAFPTTGSVSLGLLHFTLSTLDC